MLRALTLALGFLTRISVPTGNAVPVQFWRALVWFPSVGLLLGVLLTATFFGAGQALGPNLTAGLTLGTWVWLTGGLHADGLADTIDGLSAAHGNPARGLEVMREPAIGAHGALSLVVVALLKFAALSDLASTNPAFPVLCLVLVGSLAGARLWIAQIVITFPSARKEGLGARFADGADRTLCVLGIAPWVVASLVLAWGEPRLLASATLGLFGTGALMFTLAWRWSKAFGGLTGDLYGALIELGEAASLLLWHVALSPQLLSGVFGPASTYGDS